MQSVVKINDNYVCNLRGSNFVQKQFDKAPHRVIPILNISISFLNNCLYCFIL